MGYKIKNYERDELYKMTKEELIIELLTVRNAYMELKIRGHYEEKKVLSGEGGKNRINFKNVN